MSPISRGDRVGEHRAHAGNGQEQRDVGVVGAEPCASSRPHASIRSSSSSTMARLVARVVAQGSGSARPASSSRPAVPNRSRDRDRVAEGHERGVDAVLQGASGGGPDGAGSGPARARRGPLGSGSQISGTRSRRASSASTRASILSVLAASGCQALGLHRVGDRDVPAEALEGVVDEARRRSSTRWPRSPPGRGAGLRSARVRRASASG